MGIIRSIDGQTNDGQNNDGQSNDGQSNDRQNNDRQNNDRRSEARRAADLALTVWGVDIQGEHFLQDVHAQDISLSGALLSGLDTDLKSGDVIGILYAGKKARYRVIWIRYDGTGDKMQVAVHRVQTDPCPWMELLQRKAEPHPVTTNPVPGRESRP
jgi:hypothetical protein